MSEEKPKLGRVMWADPEIEFHDNTVALYKTQGNRLGRV